MLRYGTTKHWRKNKIIVYILFRELSKKRNRRRIRSLARYANCSISVRSINSSTPSKLPLCPPLSLCTPTTFHLFRVKRSVPNSGYMLSVYRINVNFLKRRFITPVFSGTSLQSGKGLASVWGTCCCCSSNVSSKKPTLLLQAQRTIRPLTASLLTTAHPAISHPSPHHLKTQALHDKRLFRIYALPGKKWEFGHLVYITSTVITTTGRLRTRTIDLYGFVLKQYIARTPLRCTMHSGVLKHEIPNSYALW